MIRFFLILAASVLLCGSALADSDWYELDRDTGATGSALTRAKPGHSYQTTIDATGQSVVIDVLNCPRLKIVGDTISTTYTPMVCESKACGESSPCHTSGAISVDQGCQEEATAAVQVKSATSGDVIVLVCGE